MAGLGRTEATFVGAESATATNSTGVEVKVPATGAETLSPRLASKMELFTSTCTKSQ